MATQVPKIAESLLTLLMCPIHLDILEHPKTLPCQHVICEKCITEWVETRGGELVCPECHIVQPLPADGVKGLPNNFKMASLCEFVESLKVQDNPEVATCGEHLTKSVDNICMHCKVPVCEDCIQTGHKEHTIMATQAFLKVTGDPRTKLIGQAKSKLKDIFTAVEVLEKTQAELKQSYDLAKCEVIDRVQQLMEIITQAQVKLNGEIDKKYNDKEAVLLAQIESLSSAKAEISYLLDLQQPEGPIISKSIMAPSGQQLRTQLDHWSQSLQLAPQENGLISVQWNEDLENRLERETLGKVVSRAVPSSHQSALSLSLSRATVETNVTIQVALRDDFGSPVDIGDIAPLSATISAPRDVTTYLQMTQGEKGVAEAIFAPKSIGKYKVEVQLFGTHIKNSPLKIIATPRGEMQINERRRFNQPHDIFELDDNFYITDKGNNQVIITDRLFKFIGKLPPPSDPTLQMYDPYAIAHTGKTFVVTDLKNHCVFEFTNSTYLQRFGQDVLLHPTGIACDSTGKIYVADGKKNFIFVFDELRENMAVLGGPGASTGHFDRPWFIDVNSQGQVVVADYGNHRIQVIDPARDEVTTVIDVQLNQKTWDVRGLTVDKNDNIYVTARQSGRATGRLAETVIAYSPRGVLLGSFGEGFNRVRGMTIIENEDNVMAIVVDGANHRIKGYLI